MGALFTQLDKYLKLNRRTFGELFAKYDSNSDGRLDGNELRALLARLVPGCGPAELLFFQRMLDVDGNGGVSADELRQAASEWQEAEMLASRYNASAEMKVRQAQGGGEWDAKWGFLLAVSG